MLDFTERTIAAHHLCCLSERDAAQLAPSETAMWFAVMTGQLERPEAKKNGYLFTEPREAFVFETDRARYLRDKTDWFEHRDCLVADNDWFYPQRKSFAKSFKKWLAIQEHDVEAVNSLYEWKLHVERRKDELADEIYDLEQAAENPFLKKLVESTLATKEAEYHQLAQLRHKLNLAIDAVRESKCKVRSVA